MAKNIVTPPAGMNISESLNFSKKILKEHNCKSGNIRYNGILIPFTIYSCYSDAETIYNLKRELQDTKMALANCIDLNESNIDNDTTVRYAEFIAQNSKSEVPF